MSVVIPSLRAAIAVPPWAKNDLWRRARAVPSLDLRFADNKSLTDAVTGASLVTFTRASNGTYVDSAGVLQTATTDVPRFHHNPTTLESLGLLVEEARTNSITNNTMVGAVAGTPGTKPTGWLFVSAASGLTQQIIGVGTESGISYIDYRFSGTTTTTGGINIAPGSGAALTGQTWTGSTYWKLAGGSNAGVSAFSIGLIEETSGGAFVTGAFYGQTAPTSGPLISQRPTATRTLSGGATVALVRQTIQLGIPTATAIDITIRIGLLQLEQGAFATSPIPTTTAAVTRSADVCSITGSAFSSWYRQDEGTVLFSGKTAPVNNIAQLAFDISEGVGSDRILSRRNTVGFVATGTLDGGVSQGGDISSATAIAGGASYVSAYAFAANNIGNSVNASAPGSITTAVMPTVDRIHIGQNFSSAQHFNGTIRRICYWNQRLANSTLQQITQ